METKNKKNILKKFSFYGKNDLNQTFYIFLDLQMYPVRSMI